MPAPGATHAGDAGAPPTGRTWRGLSTDAQHSVLDALAPREQATFLIADKRLWDYSQKAPGLSRAQRYRRMLVLRIDALQGGANKLRTSRDWLSATGDMPPQLAALFGEVNTLKSLIPAAQDAQTLLAGFSAAEACYDAAYYGWLEYILAVNGRSRR